MRTLEASTRGLKQDQSGSSNANHTNNKKGVSFIIEVDHAWNTRWTKVLKEKLVLEKARRDKVYWPIVCDTWRGKVLDLIIELSLECKEGRTEVMEKLQNMATI